MDVPPPRSNQILGMRKWVEMVFKAWVSSFLGRHIFLNMIKFYFGVFMKYCLIFLYVWPSVVKRSKNILKSAINHKEKKMRSSWPEIVSAVRTIELTRWANWIQCALYFFRLFTRLSFDESLAYHLMLILCRDKVI